MAVEITIPSPGESVTEVTVGPWHKSAGQWVEKDEILVEIESDKVTLEIPAPESGVLSVTAKEGTAKSVGDVIGRIDPDAPRPKQEAAAPAKAAAAPARAAAAAAPLQSAAPAAPAAAAGDGHGRSTPMARKIAAEKGVDLARVPGTGPSGRVTKSDVLAAAGDAPPEVASQPSAGAQEARQAVPPPAGSRGVRRERLSRLRLRVAERLVAAQHTAAMLTTFNEADMSEVIRLRRAHKEEFEKTHGVGLGFMPFFVKACVSALRHFPRVNAYIAGQEIEYHDFADISIAVGTEKGLVVPVIRNAETLSMAGIERAVADLAARARAGTLGLDEMTGGTFTISNGGVYGSMLSTPILNPPQSGILGMHRIFNRPVEDPGNHGQIVLRPMMYLALSYDHRLVDGEGAVRFLVHVKSCIESPAQMLLDL